MGEDWVSGFLIFGPVLCLWVVSFKANYLTSLIWFPPRRHFFNDDLIASYKESWRKQCCWELWEFCLTLKNNATFSNIKLSVFFFFFKSVEINGIETSLVVQWLRLPLLMQGPQVRSLGQGAKILYNLGPKNPNIKLEQYCNKFSKDFKCGTCLVVQWLRIRLTVRDTRFILVQEDSTCLRATTEPMPCNYWSPCALEPVLCVKRSHCNEQPHTTVKSSPHSWQLEKVLVLW